MLTAPSEMPVPKITYSEKGGFIFANKFCFSPGFRSVTLSEKYLFSFSPLRAQIISIIIEHIEKGHPFVHQSEVLRMLNDSRFSDAYDKKDLRPLSEKTRLRDLFKLPGGILHPCWGTLVKTTNGRDSKIYLDFNWDPQEEK